MQNRARPGTMDPGRSRTQFSGSRVHRLFRCWSCPGTIIACMKSKAGHHLLIFGQEVIKELLNDTEKNRLMKHRLLLRWQLLSFLLLMVTLNTFEREPLQV